MMRWLERKVINSTGSVQSNGYALLANRLLPVYFSFICHEAVLGFFLVLF